MRLYDQLLNALSCTDIPQRFPGVLFGDDVYRAQSRYIRAWLRAHPQKGSRLNALRLAATALDQLADFQFERAETNMQKCVERLTPAANYGYAQDKETHC